MKQLKNSLRFRNGLSFECKVAAGAWGFDALGYDDVLFNARALRALGDVPAADRFALAHVGFKLAREAFLLRTGVLSPNDFAFTTKTLTLKPLVGNPLHAWLRPVSGGYVNAVGLANPGLERWAMITFPSLIDRGIRPIISLAPNTPEEAVQMLHRLACFGETIGGIEANPGCPNTEEGKRMFEDPTAVTAIMKAFYEARGAARYPLLLKISPAHAWRTLVPECSEFVDAFVIGNSHPWRMLHPGIESPLAAFGGGGCSGPQCLGRTLDIVREAAELTSRPIIGGSGIQGTSSARLYFASGAKAVEIGTGFLDAPFSLIQMSHTLNRF